MQLGPDITGDADVVRALLTRFGITESNPPTDSQVVEIVTALARMASEGTMLPDVGAVVRALSSFVSNCGTESGTRFNIQRQNATLNWAAAIKAFDMPDRQGVDTATLKLLIAILMNSPRDDQPHAVTGFWQLWSNTLYQLRLLDALLSLPGDTFNFVNLPGRKIVTVEDVAGASPTIKSLAANVQSHTWNSLDLFEVLVQAADSQNVEVTNFVREMLDKAVKISAELVHMGLLQVPVRFGSSFSNAWELLLTGMQQSPWNEIRLDYTQRLLSMFLAGHPNHQLVFMRIWQIKPAYLTNAFRDFYDESNLNITRILDVAQDLKVWSFLRRPWMSLMAGC